jgi:hypothetical protein
MICKAWLTNTAGNAGEAIFGRHQGRGRPFGGLTPIPGLRDTLSVFCKVERPAEDVTG